MTHALHDTTYDTAMRAAAEWGAIERGQPAARRALETALAKVSVQLQTISNLAHPTPGNLRHTLTVERLEDTLLHHHALAMDALADVRKLLRDAVTP